MGNRGKRYTVATANNPKFTDEANANNARLVAAAPDLLAALREIVAAVESGEVDGYSPSGDWFREARAAIAKATGGNV